MKKSKPKSFPWINDLKNKENKGRSILKKIFKTRWHRYQKMRLEPLKTVHLSSFDTSKIVLFNAKKL